MSEPAMFWDAVGRVVSQNIAATPIDLTVNAEVVKLKNATNGEYLVKYQGDTFSAFTTDPQTTYNVNEKVFVLIPQGNFSGKKMIISRSSAQSNLTFAEQQELTNFYIPQSPNWLDSSLYGMDHTNMGICSCPRNQRQAIEHSNGANYNDYGFARWPIARIADDDFKDPDREADLEKWRAYFGEESGNIEFGETFVDATDRYPTWFPPMTQIQKADRLTASWGKTWEYIGIKAKFRTEFLAEHNRGKYGIRVEYLVKNPSYRIKTDEKTGKTTIVSTDHRKYLTKTIELTFDSFNGNPYALPVDTLQEGYFQVPKGTFAGLSSVCLFQNDEDQNVGPTEIEASDMTVDFMPEYDESGNMVWKLANENHRRNNVFACELDIRWYEKKNLLNSMFLVHITTETGNCVYNDQPGVPGIPEVRLKAHLFYGGKDILNEDDYEVHWYRECPDYRAASWPGTKKDIHNNYIASYADDGWAPIFRPDDLSYEDAPSGLFVSEFGPAKVDKWSRPVVGDGGGEGVHEAINYSRPSFRELTIPRDKVPWQWYYTCVIVQKPKAEVKDRDDNVISEENDVATSYKYKPFDDDLMVQGYQVLRTDSLYDLSVKGPISRITEGTQREMMHIENANDMDYRRNPPWPKTPWLGNWWYKHSGKIMAPFNGNAANVLGGQNGDNGNVEATRYLGEATQIIVGAIDPYLTTSVIPDFAAKTDYKEGDLIYHNGVTYAAKYDFKSDLIFMLKDWIDKGEDGDTLEKRWGSNVRELVIGVIHEYIPSGDGQRMTVEWEGQQHFIYNYDGSVKSWYSQDGFCVTPIVKWPDRGRQFVTYHAYGPEGVDSSAELESLDYYDAHPTEDETGTQTDTYELVQGTGHNPQCNSMLQNIYCENLDSGLFRIHFSVRQEYNTTYAEGQNSFYLVAETGDGERFGPFECKITFSKDGLGANGTGWSVDIDSCVGPKNVLEQNVLPYSRSRFLNPLVLFVAKDTTGQSRWLNYRGRQGQVYIRDPKAPPVYPVYLRPFVYKGGDGTGARGAQKDGYDISVENKQIADFFDFPPELGYWAETYWSVQFGSGTTDPELKFNSYLKFFKIGTNAPYSLADWTAEAGAPIPKGADWANREGVVAYTHSADANKGAIEVRFNENIVPPSDARHGYEFFRFIITAQTIIFRDSERVNANGDYEIEPHKNGNHLVTTIWSYYPVDIFLITDPRNFDIENFDPRKIDTNWPREVLYSGTGITPAFDDPAEGLYFFYGAKERKSADGVGRVYDYPKTMVSHDFQWYPAHNLTPTSQKLEMIRGGKVTMDETYAKKIRFNRPEIVVYDSFYDANGNELPDDQKVYHYEWVTQKYSPMPAVQPMSLLFGLLSTDFVHQYKMQQEKDAEEAGTPNGEHDGEEGSPERKVLERLNNDPFDGTAIFFRNQIFQLSRYSNNGVNAWNGRDIMIDNDLGTICAPTIAAGYKNPMTNDFSGVLMGIDQNQRKDGAYKANLTKKAPGVGNNSFDTSINDDAFDNRQYLNSNLFEKYNAENPFLAGVYGYQMGIPSFGLMENGTAFFGRADGGCQIILDGSNGVIYGGGNGYVTSPSIKDPMWNAMRISLTDNTRNGRKEKILMMNDIAVGELDPFRDSAGGDGNQDKIAGSYTSVNVYKGQHSEYSDGPDCPPVENAVRLDFYEYFDGVNPEGAYNPDSRFKFPSWYKKIWEKATIQRNSNLPYFLNDDYAYVCVDQLPDFQKELSDKIVEVQNKIKNGEVDIADVDVDRDIWGKEWRINYWNNALFSFAFSKDFADLSKDNLEISCQQHSTFGYGKASSTPAIEIGQHPPGLRPGILGWCAMQDVYKEFYIPGDRNFLVTYDGTMWAMNAVIIGNVIGSNIIGGRIQGCEIGIGTCDNDEPYQFQKIISDCDWPPLKAPLYQWITDPRENNVEIQGCENRVPAFYVDKFGNVSASSMRIFGGSIDIGTFHIRGRTPHSNASQQAEDNAYGELIQYGMSDFVGLVHCYGNLGVGPNTNGQSGNSGGSNFGNFTQVKGQVAMGIAYKEGDTTVHQWTARKLGMERKNYSIKSNSIAPYRASTNDKPGITGTLQQAAFFGIDASPDIPERPGDDGKTYRGHWWPMTHYYDPSGGLPGQYTDEQVPGWFTTMNLFQSKPAAVPAGQPDQDPEVQKGGNYFRVSAFGTESRFIFFKTKWQDEDKAETPSWQNYSGYFGLTQRNGDGGKGSASAWALGVQTWIDVPFICNSSCETAMRSCGFFEAEANPTVSVFQQEASGKETAQIWAAQGNYFWSGIRVGKYLGGGHVQADTKVKHGIIRLFTFDGTIALGIKDGDPNEHPTNITAQYPTHDAGMSMRASGGDEGLKGNWFWNKKEAVHIIQGEGGDGSAAISEIYMSKDGKLGISGKEEAWITVGKGAHSNPQGKPGLSIKKDKVVIGTEQGQIEMTQQIKFVGSYANENNQINIYARFA